MLDEHIGHSTLERYPLLFRNGSIIFALPSAVSCAIRRLVIERMEGAGMRDAFVAGLARGYAETFSRVRLLGGHIGAPIEFKRTRKGMLAGTTMRVDRGRYLNLVFFIDTLDGFEAGGLIGLSSEIGELESKINEWIDHGSQVASEEEGFRDGITLLVSCGVGRGTALSFERRERPNWRMEFINAPDLYTLSWVRHFEPLFLWRLFEAREKLQALGATLQNVNGLLNMVAWVKSLEGHLIPQARLPDDFISEEYGAAFIAIPTNALRDVRHEVAANWDPHVERDITGHWIRVRRDADSSIEEDRTRPLYASEETPRNDGIPAVYVASKRPWWCEIEVSNRTPGHLAYQHWKMATTWLSRAAPVLEEAFPDLPAGPILWRTRFEGARGDLDDAVSKIGYAEARAQISIDARAGGHEVVLIAARKFDDAHFNEDNIAERALVETLVTGVGVLGGRDLSEIDRNRLVESIVPDSRAREMHMFRMRDFRDQVRSSLPHLPMTLDELDASTIKLGLGWRVREKAKGSIVQGKPECLAFLAALVKSLEAELCTDLREFDRLTTIQQLLWNHEAAAVDRERWLRTASAVLSLHKDKAGAMSTIARHEFQLNGVFQATRLLAEVALCECPISNGMIPSRLDLSRSMAKMMAVQQLGGWSDAIRWDVMEPTLKIRPLGDVHAKLGFVDKIVAPFARVTNDMRIADAVENYPMNLAEVEPPSSVHHHFEPQFLDAWRDETGATLDQFRLFIAYVEDIAVRERTAVLTLPKSRLQSVALDGETLPAEAAGAIVEFLTFRTRLRWNEVPAGYGDSDRQPWRFRRRLSLLRKPLLQIDDADDPTVVVAPGLMCDAIVYTLGSYHDGAFPLRQLKSAMRSWAGTLRDKAGRRFSQRVAAKLREHGWHAEPEVKVTKLLRRGFDRDYGDVDVLAWNPATGRVLIVECKDVQYRKTYGEIAEQLADFRGEIWPDGKRDYLRRHLDRVELLSQHSRAIAEYIGAPAVAKIESHLIFKNPVPMEFALKHMAERVSVGIFDRLDKI